MEMGRGGGLVTCYRQSNGREEYLEECPGQNLQNKSQEKDKSAAGMHHTLS